MSPIYIASAYGHLGVVDLIFEKGGNIHDKNNDGLSPIEIASQNGKIDEVVFLLSKGANERWRRIKSFICRC